MALIVYYFRSSALFSFILLALITQAFGSTPAFSTHSDLTSSRTSLRRGLIPGLPIRLLPLGDSITAGLQSSDDNGYRLDLQRLLDAGGNKVTYIGSRINGKNNTNDLNEGFGGFRINAILDGIQKDAIMAQQPNLVLIHAGTNDNVAALPGEPMDQASVRLEGLVDYVLCSDPSAVVILAMLVENKYNETQTALFNSRVPSIVAKRVKAGHKVALVDMTAVKGDEMSDMLHPNDVGYMHMANLWYSAIISIPDNWWVSPQPWINARTSLDGMCGDPASGQSANTTTSIASASSTVVEVTQSATSTGSTSLTAVSTLSTSTLSTALPQATAIDGPVSGANRSGRGMLAFASMAFMVCSILR